MPIKRKLCMYFYDTTCLPDNLPGPRLMIVVSETHAFAISRPHLIQLKTEPVNVLSMLINLN